MLTKRIKQHAWMHILLRSSRRVPRKDQGPAVAEGAALLRDVKKTIHQHDINITFAIQKHKVLTSREAPRDYAFEFKSN